MKFNAVVSPGYTPKSHDTDNYPWSEKVCLTIAIKFKA